MRSCSVEKKTLQHFYFMDFLWTIYFFNVENSKHVLCAYAGKEENTPFLDFFFKSVSEIHLLPVSNY